MSTFETIQVHHLARKAVIYIRQSSPNQVISHQESLRLQYGLKQRALSLGWQEPDIEVIDSDLGLSGASTQHRQGFKDMLSKVALCEVGIILSFEVTRLSRNCSDWYPLLDICGYSGCLIADTDGVYDPATPNGRLLLGLKGQLSELELHTLKNRLTAGLINKAKRGELALKLPVGLVRDESGDVVKDPHLEVQSRLDLLFTTFLRLGSASKTLRYFNEHHLGLPRRNRYGDLVWKRPTVSAIISTLKNPAYAGAFAYGRSQSMPAKSSHSRKMIQKKLPLGQWRVLVKDKYPAYINWETFEKIQAKLMDNYAEYDRNKSRGIPRKGMALIHGIAYCGECGHKMVVQYKTVSRYICNALRQQYLVPVCQYIPAGPVDDKVVEAFFEAFSPIEIDAYAHVLKKIKDTEEQTQLAQRQQVQRLDYQANLAQRQFQQVDPDNRLVAAELEARWEHALRQLKQSQQDLEQNKPTTGQLKLPNDMAQAFKDIGQHLPEIWQQPYLSTSTKKELIRCLIDKVIIHRSAREQLQIRIVWRGGATTTTYATIDVASFAELSHAEEIEKLILELTAQEVGDEQIAEQLTQKGYRSPRTPHFLTSTVRNIRLKHRILITPSQSHPRHIPNYLTVPQLAQKLRLPSHWIYDGIKKQRIQISKDSEKHIYLFPDKPKTIEDLLKLKNGKVQKVIF